LTLLEAKGSIGPIFSFFLGDFLEAFLALYFYRKLVIKVSSKDLLDLESSPLALGTLPLNRNKLYNIFAFKPLTSLKGNSRGSGVTSSSIDSSSSSLALIVKASTKSL
jgi:hypothetical protein